MAKFWALAVAACLLCQAMRGLVCSKQTFSDMEQMLGVDMCPECKLMGIGQESSLELKRKVDFDTCREVCDEGHRVPTLVTLRASSSDEEDLGSDICPERMDTPVGPKIQQVHSTDWEECGADKFREKGQPISPPFNDLGHGQEHSSSLVKELQELVQIQKTQIGQLADILQQFHKTKVSKDFVMVDQEVVTLSKKPEAGVEVTHDEVSGQHLLGPTVPLGSKRTGDQDFAGTEMDQKIISQTGKPKVGIVQDGSGSGVGSMTVARYRPAWSEHFSFLSAVKVDGEVSYLHVLPQEGENGVSRYVVVGDSIGRLYIFTWHGDCLLDHLTISAAPVTAMLSYTLLKNETILVTGHADGAVLVHRIWEAIEQGSVSGDDTTTLSLEFVHSLIPPPPQTSRTKSETHYVHTVNVEVARKEDAQVPLVVQSVMNLNMYKVGKMRYTLVSDMSGKIQLFRDNGTLYGVAESSSRPLAFMRTPSAQRLVFLTEDGVGSLDLRSMLIKSSPCEGLNNSRVMAYAFDAAGRTKANGFTAEGDLVYVALTGDMLHNQCHVKKRRKIEVPGPFAPQAVKGYLLAATPDHVLVFNTTLHMGFNYASYWVGGPRPLFSVSMSEIAQSFLQTPIARSCLPVMASNRDKLVVIGLGDGYVAIFRSNLPTIKPSDFSSKFWSNPIFVGALVLLGLWQFFTRRREPATVVPSEYPLAASSAQCQGYRKAETLRLNFGERESLPESRRFRSPTRGYVAPNSTTFSPGALSFRSSTVDSGSYSTRREPLFLNSQPVGELRET